MPPYDEALVAFDFDFVPVWKWRPREVDNLDFAFGGVPNLFEVVIDDAVREWSHRNNNCRTTSSIATGSRTSPSDRAVLAAQRRPGGAIGGIIASAAVGDGRVFFSTAVGDSFAMIHVRLRGARRHRWAVLWGNLDVLP